MIGYIAAREVLRLFVFIAVIRVCSRIVLRLTAEPVPPSRLDAAASWVIRGGVVVMAARLVGYV